MSKEKIKKVFGLVKYVLGQIMKEFVGLRPKTYSYLEDSDDENKNSKRQKKYVSWKENLNFKIINTF